MIMLILFMFSEWLQEEDNGGSYKMKTRTIFLRIVAFCAMFFIVSCSKNSKSPQNLISSEKTANSSEDLLVHIPMPAKLDSAMRKSFDAETYVELKKLNFKNVKSFYITKENYLSMIDLFI